mgnify:CR=1 FL=1
MADPFAAFQIGAQLGQGQSTLGHMVRTIVGQFGAQQEAQRKIQTEVQTQKALIPFRTGAAKELLQEKARLFPPQPKSLSGETAGKLSLASQGTTYASRAKSLLFPTGTPDSFNRGLIARMQSPFGIGMVGSGEAQSLEFNLKRAIDAQLRSETGAAVSPGELDRLTKAFIANSFANPVAAFERLEGLESGLGQTSNFIDPTGRYRKMGASPFEPSGEDLNSVSDEDILRGAGLME